MMLTGERFGQIGEALFGPRWKAVLAHMIDRDSRTVRYYIDGNTIPVELIDKLEILCRSRGEALLRIADEIKRAR